MVPHHPVVISLEQFTIHVTISILDENSCAKESCRNCSCNQLYSVNFKYKYISLNEYWLTFCWLMSSSFADKSAAGIVAVNGMQLIIKQNKKLCVI